ncbi:MAG TPA: hypothetical protein VGL81_08490 [Polyangiaceae bacterium]|jgi:hypothetical protein
MRVSRGVWVGSFVLAAAAACSSGDDSSFPSMGAEGGAPHYDAGGDDATSPDEAGHDAAPEAAVEAGGGDDASEAGLEGTEAGLDAAMEASSTEDAGGEGAASEAGEEASVEAGHEAGVEAGAPEAGEEAGVDGGHEAGAEAGAAEGGADAGVDAPVEAAVDAGEDAPPETSTVADTGADAEPDAKADAPSFVAPSCDGVIGPNEYGGAGNQAASSSGQTWLMTWDDTNVYLAIEGANVLEGDILYFATSGAGISSGELYDSTNVTALPFDAQLVAYAHDGYTEARVFTAGGWGAPDTTSVKLCDSAAMQVREEVIPWSLLGGKPASFGWTGYVAANGNTNVNGYIYGQMPTGNPSGAPANNDTFTQYYEESSTAAAPSTPFAVIQ